MPYQRSTRAICSVCHCTTPYFVDHDVLLTSLNTRNWSIEATDPPFEDILRCATCTTKHKAKKAEEKEAEEEEAKDPWILCDVYKDMYQWAFQHPTNDMQYTLTAGLGLIGFAGIEYEGQTGTYCTLATGDQGGSPIRPLFIRFHKPTLKKESII